MVKEEKTGDEFYLRNILDDIQGWLIRLTYWYGWLSGIATERTLQKQGSPRDYLPLYDYDLATDQMEYHWYRHKTRIYLNIYQRQYSSAAGSGGLSNMVWHGKQLNDHLVFGYQTIGAFPHEFLVEIVDNAERMIRKFFPEIHASNSFRICESPVHLLDTDKPLSHPDLNKRLGFCNRVGERWICVDCQEQFLLDPEYFVVPDGLNVKQKAMFSRLNPAKRLSILERDRFTCTNCQRSPLKGDTAKLTVVHRVPVTEKGKTVPENLITVCQHCCPNHF